MKRCILFVCAALFALPALAGKTQATTSDWKAAGKSGHWYGRSDGVYQENDTKSLYSMENGKPAQSIGAGFEHDFTVYADGEGLVCMDQSGLGACGGNTTLVPCLCTDATGTSFIWMPLVTATLPPDMDAGTLDIAGDQTDNDGSSLIWGVGGASGRPFVIGRDPAFYMCTKADATDITGIDNNIMAGFMEQGANEVWNADFEARNSYAGIGVVGTAAAGVTSEDITIKTEDDGAGVTTTDTTDDHTEGTPITYCVYVSAAGVVTYTINGVAPTATAAYTFDDNISVVPFMNYLHTADLADEIDVYTVRVGYQD